MLKIFTTLETSIELQKQTTLALQNDPKESKRSISNTN